jgi:hypothetical protein
MSSQHAFRPKSPSWLQLIRTPDAAAAGKHRGRLREVADFARESVDITMGYTEEHGNLGGVEEAVGHQTVDRIMIGRC